MPKTNAASHLSPVIDVPQKLQLKLPGASAELVPTHVMLFGVEVRLSVSLGNDLKTQVRAVMRLGGWVSKWMVVR